MLKKNPHKSRNDMKLFLYCQVKQRAVDVHETMEEIEEKKEQRVVNLHNTRQRTYEKKLEGLLFFCLNQTRNKILISFD
jgi:hypothetical protein